MLLAQGTEGERWIYRLPGYDACCNDRNAFENDVDGHVDNAGNERPATSWVENGAGNVLESCLENGAGKVLRRVPSGCSSLLNGHGCCSAIKGNGGWWFDGGVAGASLFERECDRAARRIGMLFDGIPQ